MQFSTTLLASFLALVAAAPSNSKVVTFPVTRHHPNSEFAQVHQHLNSRQEPIPITLTNKQAYYSIAVGLGTPVQNFNLLLDTGSSDLWVYNITDTNDCSFGKCDATGQFNDQQSSTYTYISDDYFIQYVSGNAYGNWGTDTLTAGSVSLPNFQFACASSAGGSTGVLGISVEKQESLGGDPEYPNFPVALQNAGYIDRLIYSLYLDSDTSSTGTLLMGGIDHAKYSGDLVVLPMSSTKDLQVNYNSISYGGNDIDGQGSCVLDSGTSLTYIPSDAFYSLTNALGISSSPDDSTGLVDIDCNADVSVDFNFAGVTITATASQLILSTGDGSCGLGILPNSDSQYITIFGDTFLRNAYIAYDLQDSQIGMAQAVYTSDSNIQPQTSPLSN